MAGGLRLALADAHRAALVDFRGVVADLLVREWSTLILGGGTVLAMRWNHRHSTDLDFVVEEDEPPDAGALRKHLEALQRRGRIDVWRYARRRSVMLTAGGVRLSFVFEGRDAGVPIEGRTALDIRCESPAVGGGAAGWGAGREPARHLPSAQAHLLQLDAGVLAKMDSLPERGGIDGHGRLRV